MIDLVGGCAYNNTSTYKAVIMSKILITLLFFVASVANASDSDKYQKISPQTLIYCDKDKGDKVNVEIHKPKSWSDEQYTLVRVNTDEVVLVLIPGYRQADSILDGKLLMSKFYIVMSNGNIRFITKSGKVFCASTKIIDDSK